MIEKQIQQHIIQILTSFGVTTQSVSFEFPHDSAFGDISTNVALVYGPQCQKKPQEFAHEIITALVATKPAWLEKAECAGPGFINLFLKRSVYTELVSHVCTDSSYGTLTRLSGEVWEVEHTSPNPNKAMHIGHLRNNVTSMALTNILEAHGARVIRDAVDNNRGIAIAKLMWGYLLFAKKDGERIEDISYWVSHKDEWHTPETRGVRPDRFVDELYVTGSDDFKKVGIEAKVRDLVVRWEAKEQNVWDLWAYILSFAHEGQARTLKRLGNVWDYVWHEHEHYQQGKDFVEKGLAQGVFRKLDDGAILTSLETFNLPDTIVQKSDGTALYITQDIALTQEKKSRFNPTKMVWVIGPEQSLAMRQMFAVCEQLKIASRDQMLHIPYGYMSIKGKGKMSSREGTVIYIDDVIDEAKALVVDKISSDISDSEREQISECVAVGAVKFSILKAGRMTDIAFDFDTSLDIEGDSGPYVQYTYARIQSLLVKIATEESVVSTDSAVTEVERILLRFPYIIERAGIEYSPNLIATYLIDLSRAFNSFYANTKILGDSEQGWRVMLSRACGQVIKKGLSLLGITTPSRM